MRRKLRQLYKIPDANHLSPFRYASGLHSRGRNAGLRLAFLRKCVFFDTGMCFLKTGDKDGDKDDEWALYPKK